MVANLAAFSLRHPGGLNIAGEYTGKLDNDGEQLQILDALGENILEFSYNDVWHDPTDDDGYSLVLLDPATTPVTDFDRPANWGVSLTEGGDPGTESTGTSMTYAFWKYQHFTENEMSDPLVTGDSLDLDSDTLGTVLEYGFGRNPRTSDAAESYRASIVNDGGTDYLAMTFRRQKNSLDLTYLVEVSSDLSDWTTVNTLTGTPVDNGDGTETVTIRDNAAVSPDTPRFGRITVAVGP